MSACETIKVNPWGKDQGDYVEINAEDFDPKKHTKYGEAKDTKSTKKASK